MKPLQDPPTGSHQHPDLTTERLLLRPVTPALIHELFNTATREEIFRFFGFSESDYEHYLNMHTAGMETHRLSHFYFLLIRRSDLVPIGECGFHTWNRSHNKAELFYLLRDDSYKQQGYMTEALRTILDYGFTNLALHRIEAKVDKDNTPSMRLLQRFGFTFEGTLRQDYVVKGKNEDSECYSLLKHEWNQVDR